MRCFVVWQYWINIHSFIGFFFTWRILLDQGSLLLICFCTNLKIPSHPPNFMLCIESGFGLGYSRSRKWVWSKIVWGWFGPDPSRMTVAYADRIESSSPFRGCGRIVVCIHFLLIFRWYEMLVRAYVCVCLFVRQFWFWMGATTTMRFVPEVFRQGWSSDPRKCQKITSHLV